jgi:hypothetical protein
MPPDHPEGRHAKRHVAPHDQIAGDGERVEAGRLGAFDDPGVTLQLFPDELLPESDGIGRWGSGLVTREEPIPVVIEVQHSGSGPCRQRVGQTALATPRPADDVKPHSERMAEGSSCR